VGGCASAPSQQLLDVRAALLVSAEEADPDFPDGSEVLLTHFSHVGRLVASVGEVIYVAAGYEHLRAYHARAYGSSGGADDREDQSAAPVIYRSAQYAFTFSLPASWQGYTVAIQQWEGQTYGSATDQVVVTERGPIIVLRHPQWRASDPYLDIPILVFTRRQWEKHHQGRFSVGAGGVEIEIGHNSNYVFAISSRFNAADGVKGWQEATDIVGHNQTANGPPLHPE
jgi:hypothetical protein